MMLSAPKHIKEVSALRRMLFAATYLPEDTPNKIIVPEHERAGQ